MQKNPQPEVERAKVENREKKTGAFAVRYGLLRISTSRDKLLEVLWTGCLKVLVFIPQADSIRYNTEDNYINPIPVAPYSGVMCPSLPSTLSTAPTIDSLTIRALPFS